MPLFAFPKKWFDPNLPLVHRFLVGKGLGVALDPFQIIGKEGAMDLPPLVCRGPLLLHRAGIANGGIRTVLGQLCFQFSAKEREHLPLLGNDPDPEPGHR